MVHEGDGDTSCSWCTLNPPSIGKGTRRLENKRTSEDHPDYSFIKVGQNTENNPGNLIILVLTQTPVKNSQRNNNNNNKQKGCHRGIKRTADLQYIDQNILKKSKALRKM